MQTLHQNECVLENLTEKRNMDEEEISEEELELYMPDEIFIQDGKLNVRTRHRAEIGPQQKVYHYTSGWIDTKNKFSQRFGKFEANCSLPSRLARGVWPAFWLLPESDLCWPTGGEVDIFEFNADPIQDKTWGSYHWGDKCGADRAKNGNRKPDIHRYTFGGSADKCQRSIDNRVNHHRHCYYGQCGSLG